MLQVHEPSISEGLKNTYLTIDLDFWSQTQVDIAWIGSVLGAVPEGKRPCRRVRRRPAALVQAPAARAA